MFRLLLLDNGWADCVEIWYAIGDHIVAVQAVVTVGIALRVHSCTPRFSISGATWPIVFTYGAWVGGH